MNRAARGIVLDAGAFIALERREAHMTVLLREIGRNKVPLVTASGVVAQVWRGGHGKQAPVAVLLGMTEVSELTRGLAKTLGMVLGATKTSDSTDAHVVYLARARGWPVLTSDPDDLRAIDATIHVEVV